MESHEGERVIAADRSVSVLPDPAAVFDAEQPWLERVLHPLVSIELSAVRPDWIGRVSLLSPVEPESGLLGEETLKHHDDHTGENWISFHVDEHGRHRFLGDRRFFQVENPQPRWPRPGALDAHYEAAGAEIEGTRIRYAHVGALVWGDRDDPTKQRKDWGTDIALIDQLGGEPGYGNWTAFPPPPAFVLDESDDDSPTLRLADGRPFTFVASTAGYPWRSQGADAILLFFEPETRTAVLTFDWT